MQWPGIGYVRPSGPAASASLTWDGRMRHCKLGGYGYIVDRDRPWTEFTFSVPKESMQIFQAATRAVVVDGRDTLFWEDLWLDGYRIQELAPRGYIMVPTRTRTRGARTVFEAIMQGRWARDIGPVIDMDGIAEYMSIWPSIAVVHLQGELRIPSRGHGRRTASSRLDRPTRQSSPEGRYHQPRHSHGDRGPRSGADSLHG